MKSLNETLGRFNFPPLKRLDLYHVTIGKYISDIISIGKLEPRYCQVFKEKLLYFSYGLPFYRPQNIQTEDAAEFPVVFVFHQNLISGFIEKCFPFDTGGVHQGVFTNRWKTEFNPIDDYCIKNEPERLVWCFYEKNENYLKGHVCTNARSNEDPILKIHKFLSENLARDGVDQRQRTVECISKSPLEILPSLLWVAYPQSISLEVAELWERAQVGFAGYPYEADVNENPSALITHIRKVAKDRFGFRFRPPGS